MRKGVANERLSLENLKKNSPAIAKKLKPSPDLENLRKVLGEALNQAQEEPAREAAQEAEEKAEKTTQEIQSENEVNNDKKILHPGDSIKF